MDFFPGPCEGRLPVTGSCPCRAAGWPPVATVLQWPGPARSPVPGAGSRPSGGECGVRAARPPSLPAPRPKGTPRWLSAPLSQPRGAGHLASAWRGVRRTNCHCPPCRSGPHRAPSSGLQPQVTSFTGKRFVTDESICVLGISKRNLVFRPVVELKKETDFE